MSYHKSYHIYIYPMTDLRADKKLAQTGAQHVELEVEPPLAAEMELEMGRGGF
jgi:hypothetical protein